MNVLWDILFATLMIYCAVIWVVFAILTLLSISTSSGPSSLGGIIKTIIAWVLSPVLILLYIAGTFLEIMFTPKISTAKKVDESGAV
ncbi:MAG: hypothetical protein AAB443_04500 [Patescibacteria group bacterium]